SIDFAPGETWQGVDKALRKGTRGLPGGSSLSNLIMNKRQFLNNNRKTKTARVRKYIKTTTRNNRVLQKKAPLTTQQILAWSDEHYRNTGKWPNQNSGAILSAPGETWRDVDSALRRGNRGLSGHSSLARLLSEQRSVANRLELPLLTVEQI